MEALSYVGSVPLRNFYYTRKYERPRRETETPFTRDRTNSGPDEFLHDYGLRSHGTTETGRIRAPLTVRIRDPKNLGLAFYRNGSQL